MYKDIKIVQPNFLFSTGFVWDMFEPIPMFGQKKYIARLRIYSSHLVLKEAVDLRFQVLTTSDHELI